MGKHDREQQLQLYYSCKTCGKYVSRAHMQSGGYCSAACMGVFGQCVTCGRYVLRDELHLNHFCGPECAKQYEFLKTLGPRPVIVTSGQIPHGLESENTAE